MDEPAEVEPKRPDNSSSRQLGPDFGPWNADTQAVGLIAGWGRYPLVLAEALQRQQRRVVAVGIAEHVDPALRERCDAYCEVGMFRLGAALRFLRGQGITQATMAGKFHKVLLFRRGLWWKHRPDWAALRTFYAHFVAGTKDRRDDTLLSTLVDAFAHRGITFGPATDLVPDLLIRPGQLTRRGASAAERRDIAFGWELAREMGRLDVGQSVAVKGQAVLAVEAVEGTDECIRRAGQLCPAGGFTIVKVAKPQQDMRFDVPTIGLGTLQTMHEAGARVLAVEAQKTILVDGPQAIDFANRHGLTLLSLVDGRQD